MPAQALRLQRGVDLVSASGRIATNTWGAPAIAATAGRPWGQRSPVGNADEVFLEQRLALDVAGRVRKDAERQVDFPSASCASMASRLAWLMAMSIPGAWARSCRSSGGSSRWAA